jgi:Dolichyl-phosphate-mannose-protein mannosyltransferase
MWKNPKSCVVLIFSVCLLGYLVRTKPFQYATSWDVFGYYLYLPALFYHNDISLSDTQWADDLRIKYDLSGTFYQVHGVPNGNSVIQYSSGLAIILSPAFFAGHLLSGALGEAQDGFSWPYQLCITLWSFIIAFLGLFVLRKALLLLFDDLISAVVMLLIVFGTNYFIIVGTSLSTPHTHLFTIYALAIYYNIKLHENYKRKYWIYVALSIGLACLARPTELLLLIIPVFWGCFSISDLRQKLSLLFRTQSVNIILFVLVMFLMASPQLVYWKITTGHFFFMSYTNPGEGLDFLNPHTLNFLFSYRKGWFIYTPLMLIAFFGFVYLYKSNRKIFTGILLFVILNVYILSSWSCWWYAFCYGQRSMVQSLPVMAILLGYVILSLRKKNLMKWLGVWAIVLAVSLNVFQMWQYTHGILPGDRITGAYYWTVFGKTKPDPATKKLLLVERVIEGENAFKNKEGYSSQILFNISEKFIPEKGRSVILDSTEYNVEVLNEYQPFSDGYSAPWKALTTADHNWIHAEAEIYCPEGTRPNDVKLVLTFEHKGGCYGYSALEIKPEVFKPNEWNTISCDYLTPEVRHPDDVFKYYVWCTGKTDVYLRRLELVQWEPLRGW